MAENLTWIFEQLGGERRKLELTGHAAPHGGARRDSVADEELVLRESEVYYDGNSAPTRHIAGERINPIVIKGIWMDRRGGPGFAQAKKAEMKAFFRGIQQVRVSWGSTVSFVGLIRRVRFSNEAEFHVPWEIEFLVDQDLLAGEARLPQLPRAAGPGALVNDLQNAVKDAAHVVQKPLLMGDRLEVLSSFVTSVNNVSAALRQTAEGINSFANAPFAEIRRFRAGVGQFLSVVTIMRRTVDEISAQMAVENENATEWTRWWDVQAAWSSSALQAIQLAIEADRAAVAAEQGVIRAFYTAREGDTWESISTAVYGDSSRAADIRAANGVEGGAQPNPGTTYFCPR